MPGAQNGPPMNNDPVNPRQGVAGGPVGYKHGMRNGHKEEQAQGDTGHGWARSPGQRSQDGEKIRATRARGTKQSLQG